MNLTILLNRLLDNGNETIGRASLIAENFTSLLDFVTLERSWLDNLEDISCIPPGKYVVLVRYSDKYGRHLEVTNVMGRTEILFHWGNYYTNSKGCILVGKKHAYIDKDRNLDVSNSKPTFKKLMDSIKDNDNIQLVITPTITTKKLTV